MECHIFLRFPLRQLRLESTWYGKYLLDGFFLLRNGVFSVVAAMLANDLWLFGGVRPSICVEGVKKPKCREALIIWMFEFFEESNARRVRELSNIERWYVDYRGMGVRVRRKTSLVLTFVLLSTHLIIIRQANINSIEHTTVTVCLRLFWNHTHFLRSQNSSFYMKFVFSKDEKKN